MMKLEYGSSAVGVTLVNDVAQCLQVWNVVQGELCGENSHPGIGLGHGNSMLLMDYVDGTEHDVDIIIYRRKLIGAYVSDNGPTRVPRFTETAAAMPSFLPMDKHRQLVVAAYQCCVEIGLVSGVFNVELKMTTTGPKLIEINARMGGFYLRDWIHTIYNVDILQCAFMICCGICPCLPPDPKPMGQLIGVMTVPSAHRKALSDPANMRLLQLLEDNGVVRVNRIEAGHLPPPEEDCYEEPYANIAVLDRDPEVAKSKILGVFTLLGMNTKEYPVEEFLRDFRNS
jgi:carnosine synthase